jgi:hypothetical protein
MDSLDCVCHSNRSAAFHPCSVVDSDSVHFSAHLAVLFTVTLLAGCTVRIR